MKHTRRFARHALVAVSLWLVFVSCGGGGGASTPTAPAAATPSNTWSVSGRVVSLDTGTGVAGATVTPSFSLAAVTADGDGNYKLGDANVPGATPLPVSVSADGMITHDVLINWVRGARTGVEIDLIHDAPPFSMDFYRQLVRGTYDRQDSGAPFADLRWTTAPSFYVRTADQDGNPIESDVIDHVIDGIQRAVPAWSAGQYTPAAIETGTDVRTPRVGWITVDIKRDPSQTTVCGQAQIGANPGSITLWEGVCGCPAFHGIPGTLVVHEVGHSMGFFHVGDTKSTMYPFIQTGCGPGAPTGIEGFHSAIAYSRPRGNIDPDKDPSTSPLAVKQAPVETCPRPPR